MWLPGLWRCNHCGRLPGITNCKPKHRQANGLFPFVLLRSSSGSPFTRAAPEAKQGVVTSKLNRGLCTVADSGSEAPLVASQNRAGRRDGMDCPKSAVGISAKSNAARFIVQ
ncbi:MAG TPA: DNA-primase RepB domain-containing protein [Terracidiphilus sp.]